MYLAEISSSLQLRQERSWCKTAVSLQRLPSSTSSILQTVSIEAYRAVYDSSGSLVAIGMFLKYVPFIVRDMCSNCRVDGTFVRGRMGPVCNQLQQSGSFWWKFCFPCYCDRAVPGNVFLMFHTEYKIYIIWPLITWQMGLFSLRIWVWISKPIRALVGCSWEYVGTVITSEIWPWL